MAEMSETQFTRMGGVDIAYQVVGSAWRQGDGAAVSDERKLIIKGLDEAEVLLFDLA